MSKPDTDAPKPLFRKYCRSITFFAFVCGLLFVIITMTTTFTSPAPVEFSKDTTYVLEPKTADGQYIDYVSLLPAELIENDPRDDLWTAMLFRDPQRSSRTALLRVPEAIYEDPIVLKQGGNGESSEAYEQRSQAHTRSTFTEADDADFAAIIDANEPWYEAIIQNTPDPVCVAPALSNTVGRPVLHNIHLPLTGTHSTLSTTFQHRAMLSLGRENFARTLESLQVIATLSTREAQLPFYVNESNSLRFKQIAARIIMTTLLSLDELNETQIKDLVSSLPQRTPDRDKELLHQVRLTLLDVIQEWREIGYEELFYGHPLGINVSGQVTIKDGPIAAFQNGGLKRFTEWKELNRIRRSVDCNRLMRAINQQHDELQEKIGRLSFQEWQIELQREQDRLDKQLSIYDQDLTEYCVAELTQIAKHNALGLTSFFPEYSAADTNLHRCVRVVSRIRQFHQYLGIYPNSFDELYSTELGNEPRASYFIDAFSNEPLLYRKTNTGFVLSSSGKDLVDDSAEINTNGDLPELTDDFIFVWTTE